MNKIRLYRNSIEIKYIKKFCKKAIKYQFLITFSIERNQLQADMTANFHFYPDIRFIRNTMKTSRPSTNKQENR